MQPTDAARLLASLVGGVFGLVFLIAAFALPIAVVYGLVSVVRSLQRISAALEQLANRPTAAAAREPEIGPWRRGPIAARSESSSAEPSR